MAGRRRSLALRPVRATPRTANQGWYQRERHPGPRLATVMRPKPARLAVTMQLTIDQPGDDNLATAHQGGVGEQSSIARW